MYQNAPRRAQGQLKPCGRAIASGGNLARLVGSWRVRFVLSGLWDGAYSENARGGALLARENSYLRCSQY